MFVATFVASLLCVGIRSLGRDSIALSIILSVIMLPGFVFGCIVKLRSSQAGLLDIAVGGLWGALFTFLGSLYFVFLLS